MIIVKARVFMKATNEGGRQTGFVSGYRPDHVFELPTEDSKGLTAYIGDILFEEQKLFEHGETQIVTVRFLRTPQVEKYIKVGQKWFINEAARTIGFGEILEI